MREMPRGRSHDSSEMASAPPGKRSRAVEEQIGNRKGCLSEVPATKQQRLIAFFDIHAAASASSGEQRAQASATMGTDASSAAGPGEARDMEPKRRQGEMVHLREA